MKEFRVVLIPIIIMIVLFIGYISVAFIGGNRQIIDTNYKYNSAIIKDIGEVNVSKWNDYEDGMIQIITTDNRVYYTHGSNIILFNK